MQLPPKILQNAHVTLIAKAQLSALQFFKRSYLKAKDKNIELSRFNKLWKRNEKKFF